MKRNHLSTAAAILAAASIGSGTAVAQTSGGKQQNPETIRPDISAPGTSKGGTQSQRTSQTGTPLPKGSPFSGTVEMGRANSPQDVKAAQRALQEKGHNPGPIDGMMGPRTREALKSFQTASGVETTGTLNKETAEKLGVDLGPSKDSNDMNTGKSSSR
jgi:peptidoglycan hydrolase-like protein with peptidoglycan-binding domain